MKPDRPEWDDSLAERTTTAPSDLGSDLKSYLQTGTLGHENTRRFIGLVANISSCTCHAAGSMLVLGCDALTTSTVYSARYTGAPQRMDQTHCILYLRMSQRKPLQSPRSVSNISPRAKEFGATHQPPCHRTSCFAGSPKPSVLQQSSPRGRNTAAALPYLLIQNPYNRSAEGSA